jgi:DNA-binding transcriptional regulator YhcF (GntR family)
LSLREIASRLDRSGGAPLYKQVAQLVRWEIGMGRFGLGTPLPPIRTAATVLGLNFHTVRRAYAMLVRAGVLESARRRGTRVCAPASLPPVDSEGGFTTVVECNLTQASQIAAELVHRGCRATPWLLDWPEPPPGSIVTTTFHSAAVRRRWPQRRIRVVVLRPHPNLAESIAVRLAALGLRELLLLERDTGTSHGMMAELRNQVGGFSATVSTLPPKDALARYPKHLLLIAPRVLDSIPWAIQSHPRILEVRFTIFADGPLTH